MPVTKPIFPGREALTERAGLVNGKRVSVWSWLFHFQYLVRESARFGHRLLVDAKVSPAANASESIAGHSLDGTV